MAEGLNLKISAHAVAASELPYHNNASLLQNPYLLSKQKLRFFQTIKLEAGMSGELSTEAVYSSSAYYKTQDDPIRNCSALVQKYGNPERRAVITWIPVRKKFFEIIS